MLTTRKLTAAICLLGVVALVAGAAPGFTADNGTVVASVSVPAPPAPCLTVTPGTVDFGTQSFSTNNVSGIKQSERDITVGFCGTAAGQNLLGSTTPATGLSGSWTPKAYEPTLTIEPCPEVNRFYLSLFGFTTSSLFMTETPAPVRASLGGPPAVFPVGDKVFRLTLIMPCQGSNGAGETKSLTSTYTAVVA